MRHSHNRRKEQAQAMIMFGEQPEPSQRSVDSFSAVSNFFKMGYDESLGTNLLSKARQLSRGCANLPSYCEGD